MKIFKKIWKNTALVFSSLITISILCFVFVVYAFFTDYVSNNNSGISVPILDIILDEDAPFNNLAEIPPEGAGTFVKTFRVISKGNQSAYVRARLIPIVEIYDDTLNDYVVINIDENEIKLDVSYDDWIYSNGYYYYKNILAGGKTTEDVIVTFMGFSSTGNYSGVDIRLTIKVEIESAQVYNEVWKQVFSIEQLPQGVE